MKDNVWLCHSPGSFKFDSKMKDNHNIFTLYAILESDAKVLCGTEAGVASMLREPSYPMRPTKYEYLEQRPQNVENLPTLTVTISSPT